MYATCATPVERDEVVLAHRVELDVAHHHHLVVAEVEGRGQDVLGRHAQPDGELGVRPRHPGRGLAQALALGVLADGREQLADGRLGAGLVEGGHVLRRARPGPIGSIIAEAAPARRSVPRRRGRRARRRRSRAG